MVVSPSPLLLRGRDPDHGNGKLPKGSLGNLFNATDAVWVRLPYPPLNGGPVEGGAMETRFDSVPGFESRLWLQLSNKWIRSNKERL